MIMYAYLTLRMLRLFSSNAQGRKKIWKPSKPCHVGIHWIALAEHSQISTHVPGYSRFSGFWHHFILAKLATSSIRAKFNLIKLSICYAFALSIIMISYVNQSYSD